MFGDQKLFNTISAEAALVGCFDLNPRGIDDPVVDVLVGGSQSRPDDVILFSLPLIVPQLEMSIHPFPLVFQIFVDLRRCQFCFHREARTKFVEEFRLWN